jgi:cysteine synthase A
MGRERHAVPHWVVVGAGTGGTSATIGRYVRYRGLASQVCVVDPENSAFLPAFCGDDAGVTAACGSRIEGIGRPRVEPSFVPSVVDRMMLVPDSASVAAMRFLTERTGLRGGASTGTNVFGALRLACEMAERGEGGSIVSLLCDGSERYAGTYRNDAWLTERGWDLEQHRAVLRAAWDDGVWTG